MWCAVLFCLVYGISSGFGQNITSTQLKNKLLSADNLKTDMGGLNGKPRVESLIDEFADWASLAVDYIKTKSTSKSTEIQTAENGRRLKHKKTEMKFIIKTLFLLKLILSLMLPIGIIASKILSWKAVTLSLMAFMLAKILFVKNLLTVSGKNAFSVTPANFIPPVFIHGGPNDFFWKRQGDLPNVYPWASS